LVSPPLGYIFIEFEIYIMEKDLAKQVANQIAMRKLGLMHMRIPYDGYLEDEYNILQAMNHGPDELVK
jgi:hypothetical protein